MSRITRAWRHFRGHDRFERPVWQFLHLAVGVILGAVIGLAIALPLLWSMSWAVRR